MNKRFTKLIAALALLVGLTIPMGMWGQTTVTYTQSSTTAVSVTDGTAPTGSSASFTTTYSNMNQLTAGNSMTLTLYGYQGKKITGITLSMKSNSSKGAGTLSVTAGSTTIASISPAANFNTSSWYGAWSTTYVDVNIAMSNTNYTIQANENVVITISATVNSLYCESFTFTYEDSTAPILDPCDLTLIDAPVELEFDLYNNSNAQTISYTTSSTGEVSVAQNDYITATVDQQNKTITVIPVAVTNGAKTIRVNQVPDENYASGFVEFTVDIEDSTPFSGGDVTFVATVDKGTSPIVKSGVTFACSNGVLNNGTEYRLYKNSTTTFSVEQGTITQIAFTGVSGNPASGFETQTGWTTDGNNGTWSGNATSVSFVASNAQVRATQIVVTVDLEGTPAPVIIADDVEIAYDATSGVIEYTVNNPADGGVMGAATEAEWLTIGTIGETVPFTCSANEAATERTATVTLTYTYNRETVTKDVTITQAGNPNITMTIAEVRAQGTGNVVTTGIVTSCVGTTGYIQDATAAICVYGSELTVGDEIKVSGTLTSYNGLLEIASPEVTVLSSGNTINPELMTIAEINASTNQGWYVRIENATVTDINGQNTTIAQGENTIVVRGISGIEYQVNDIISLNGNIGCYNTVQIVNPQNVEVQESTEPSINIADATIEVAAEGGEGILTVQYENITDIVAVVYFCDAEGEAVTYDWIEAEIDDDNNVYYVIDANEGEARTAYFKVYALDDETNDVYSNLVTVSQAAYVIPFEGGTYTLATSIEEGRIYIIVGKDGEDAYAMGDQNNNNRGAVGISIDDNTATVEEGIEAYEFYIESLPEGNLYCIYDFRKEGFLYAASSSSNYLRTEDALDNNGKWNITFNQDGVASIVAQGDYTRNVMQYNSVSTLFSCYASASQKPVYLYVKEEETPEPETYELTINGYTDAESKAGYYLIASPVTVNIADVAGLTEGDFDLYSYDESQELEWINYKQEDGSHPFTTLEPGKGYLYAKKATAETPTYTFTLTGTPYDGTPIVLSKQSTGTLAGWNLIGNPSATSNIAPGRAFYIMNSTIGELIASESSTVEPKQGFFVIATEDGEEFEWTAPMDGNLGKVVMNLSRNRGTVVDRAIVRFGEGDQLPKFQLNPNNTKIYFAQADNDYAVVRSANEGEMPVSFRAAENGTYTLSIETENVKMDYLHLIDNMTGMDIDLLATPSYSFEARKNDYTSRFRLVFSANGIDEQNAETFAFFNGSEWMVSNLGESTLQVVDVMGRVLSTETISGNAELSLNQPAGVYMLRLINGNDVKVQKVIVK